MSDHPGYLKIGDTRFLSGPTVHAELLKQQREEQIRRIESHQFNKWRLGPPELLHVPSKRTPGSIIDL